MDTTEQQEAAAGSNLVDELLNDFLQDEARQSSPPPPPLHMHLSPPAPLDYWSPADEDARQERIRGSVGTGPSGSLRSDTPYEEAASHRKYSRTRFTDPDQLEMDTPEWRENVLTSPRSWQRNHSSVSVDVMREPEEAALSLHHARASMLRAHNGTKPKSKRTQGRRSSMFGMDMSTSRRSLVKLFNGMRGQSPITLGDSSVEEEESLWFTSTDDFNPPTFTLETTDTCTSYFVKASACKKNFVMKVYPKCTLTPEMEIRLRRCMSMIRTLHHPNIIRCFGVWETVGDLYMVEEYCFHGDMFAQMVTNKRSLTECYVAKQVVKPLLEVLVHLHGLGIAHRAIWPENLTFGRDGQLRLLNFLDAISVWQNRATSQHGNVDYMAPEMLRVIDPSEEDSEATLDPSDGDGGHRDEESGRVVCYDEKVDIWQLGVLVYELLAGRAPFEVEDPTLTAALILWTNVRKFPDSFSSDVISFIENALVKDPSARPTAEDLVNHPWLEAADTERNPKDSMSPAFGLFAFGSVWENINSMLSYVLRRVQRLKPLRKSHCDGSMQKPKDHVKVSPVPDLGRHTDEDDEVTTIMTGFPLAASEARSGNPVGGDTPLLYSLEGGSSATAKIAWADSNPDIPMGLSAEEHHE